MPNRSMFRLLLTALVASLAASGCGTSPATLGMKPHTVNVVRDTVDLRGDFKVTFRGLGSGYKTLATREDVETVRIILTSPRLTKPLVKEVDEEDLNKSEVTVYFEKVPAGDVQVTIQVLDENDFVIGTRENTASVKAGETTLLDLSVRLDAAAGVGSLGGSLTIEEALPDEEASAAPDPDASASPDPGATPEPAPIVVAPVEVESEGFDRGLFRKPEAEITLKNPNPFKVETELEVRFFRGGALKTTEDHDLELEAGEVRTIRVKSDVYWVDRAETTIVSTELED